MLIARLRAEAAHEAFAFEDLGLTWLPIGDPYLLVDEEGQLMTAGDFIRAGLALVWTLLVEQAMEKETDPGELVVKLGLGLASHED